MTEEKREKKKGLGGLSPEKKRLLKKLIMDRAMAELKREEEEKRKAKQDYLAAHVKPLDKYTSGKDRSGLLKALEHLYDKYCELHEYKYDWEVKLRKQDYEINELTIQVNDIKGKFVKPMLRKVSKNK